MISGPSRPPRPFYGWGFVGPNHASLSLESSQYIYLKDFTLSDYDNNMYLGPFVVAQQVLDPSPQTSYPWKEKKGGTSATVKSSRV